MGETPAMGPLTSGKPPRRRRGGLAGAWSRHEKLIYGALIPITLAAVAVVVAIRLAPTSTPAPSESAEPTDASEPTEIPPTETDIRYFRPFTDQGLPADYKVKQVEGECFGPSSTSADPAALRCIYEELDGSPIVDPCWANFDRSQVACTLTPWERDVTLIDPIIEIYEDPDADGGLVTPDPESDPFAIEVVTAQGDRYRCTAIVAYAGDIAGFRRNYGCSGVEPGLEVASIFGQLDRSKDLWRARFALASSTELVFVSVTLVWM